VVCLFFQGFIKGIPPSVWGAGSDMTFCVCPVIGAKQMIARRIMIKCERVLVFIMDDVKSVNY